MSSSNEEWMDARNLAEHLIPLLESHDVKNRGWGVIYVNNEPYNITTANLILAELSSRLNVPSEIIRSRLIELKWLNDARNTFVHEEAGRVVEELKLSAAIDHEEDCDIDEQE